jgi:outer membrane protein assembly factor BamB
MLKQLSIILALTLACSNSHAQRAFDASSTHEPIPLDGQDLWLHAAGNAKRNAIPNTRLMPSLNQPAWENTDFTPVPQSGLIADHRRVYAIARDAGNATVAVALDRTTGNEVWSSPISPPILDSWSSPAVDLEHGTLIVATGATIVALSTTTGGEVWSLTLPTTIVNASPVITSDLGDRDRVLISTYSFGFGEPAQLVCINIDAFDAQLNPFHPGEIVWSKALNADSSGNSLAYENGRVYLATASDGLSQRGTVRCYHITDDTQPTTPLWSFTNTINAGFFGGVSIAKGHIYASSYSFSGLQTSANTVKLNKRTGDLVWSVPTNRTDATPIVLPGGDVVVSSGVATGAYDFLPFFGSLPSVQFIEDRGTSASLLWDSALATHDDQNTNGVWDFGEPYLSIGGWTYQPIAHTINATPHLIVGTLPESQPGVNIGHNTDLRLIDLTKTPTDPGFIADHTQGAGNTPAVASGWIFTSGATGIRAYAPPSPMMTVRTLVDRYTRGELTLDQLLERLPR